MTATDDLVTRLRELYEMRADSYELAGDAADEIARLRAVLAEALAQVIPTASVTGTPDMADVLSEVARLRAALDGAEINSALWEETAAKNAANVEALRAQLAEAQRLLTCGSVCEIGARNPNVASYAREWEARAESAEREREALRALLAECRQWIDRCWIKHGSQLIVTPDAESGKASLLARLDAALKEAK